MGAEYLGITGYFSGNGLRISSRQMSIKGAYKYLLVLRMGRVMSISHSLMGGLGKFYRDANKKCCHSFYP